MSYEITTKETEAQHVAGLRRRTDLAHIADTIDAGFATLMAALGRASTPPTGPPFIVYHEFIDDTTEGDIEICIPVGPGTGAEGGPVVWREVPGGTVAFTVHQGPYSELAAAYAALTAWFEERGRRVAGPPREIYLTDPRETGPEYLLTEVQFPVEPAT